MFRAILFSAVLVASVAVEYEVRSADACGVKMGARRGPKVNRTAISQNPSKILIVGSRDGALVSKLRRGGHKTEYASDVSEAKHSRYDLVIADDTQAEAARARFGDNTQVLTRRSDAKSTVATAETILARKVDSRSERRNIAGAKKDREVVAAGTEGAERADPIAAGSEATPVEAARVAAESSEEEPVRVATAEPERTPEIERPEKADRPEKAVRPEKAEKPEKSEPTAAVRTNWTRTFQFGTNKTSLGGAAKRKLRANAVWLEQNPGSSLVIEGHTDSVGDEAYNLDLSERRANVALEFMIGFGIDASRISVEAKGEAEPAFEPSTSGKNRRIVLIKK